MPQYSVLLKILSVIFVAIGMVVAAAVWASGEHSTITVKAMENDVSKEEEVKNYMKEHYTPQTEHIKLEQAFADQKEDVREIKEGVNEIKNYLYSKRNHMESPIR